MLILLVIVLASATLCSFIATLAVRTVAIRRGFVDRPGGHKQHDNPVALGGGIAVTWCVCLPVLFATLASLTAMKWGTPEWIPSVVAQHLPGVASKATAVFAVLGGAIILHIVGLIDDVKPLGPAVKFTVQCLVAGTLAAGFNIRILDMEAVPVPLSVLITVIWIVGITNAFNFLDNMDGLSAGVAVISGSIFAAAALRSGQIFVPVVMLILVGALLGFLLFNFQPASIFLGDSGSLVVGYFMAVLIVLTTFYDPSKQLKPAGLFLPIVVLAVPLYDVISVSIRRIKAHSSIFTGDRRHFSHRLVERGFSDRAAVLTIYLATAATSLTGILLPRADSPAACLIFAQCLCVVLIIAILEHPPVRIDDT